MTEPEGKPLHPDGGDEPTSDRPWIPEPDSGALPPPPPPPPPALGGYAPQASSSLSAGQAVGYGWQGFKANLGPALVLALAGFLITALMSGIAANLRFDSDSPFLGALAQISANIISLVFGYFATRAALMVLDGRKIEASGVLNPDRLGPYLITAILVGVITGIGITLFVIPGVIAWFLLQFYAYPVIEGGASPTEALKFSVELTTKNVGPVLVLNLLLFLVVIAGALLCGVGLLAALPVAIIAHAFAWRYLTNGRIAPLGS